MLLVAAAAIAASTPQPAPASGASVQAIATIRVISGARLTFGSEQNSGDIPLARNTLIRTSDAGQQPAKLIEFQ